LGHSFGGRVAIKMANKDSSIIKKLILVDSAGIRDKRNGLSFSNKLLRPFSFLPGFSFFRKAFYKFFIGSNDYIKAQGIMKEVFKKVVEEDLVNFLESILTKTLIIWGKFDKMTPLKDGKLMNKKIKNSQLEILKSGHSPHLDLPCKLAKIIKSFIYEN